MDYGNRVTDVKNYSHFQFSNWDSTIPRKNSELGNILMMYLFMLQFWKVIQVSFICTFITQYLSLLQVGNWICLRKLMRVKIRFKEGWQYEWLIIFSFRKYCRFRVSLHNIQNAHSLLDNLNVIIILHSTKRNKTSYLFQNICFIIQIG